MQSSSNLNSLSTYTEYLLVLYPYRHLLCLSFRNFGGFHLVCSAYFYSACYFITPQYPQSPLSCLQSKINRTHCTWKGGRRRGKRGRSTTFALYCTHTALALAALQWTQLNGQQIWFICCFFCNSLYPPSPVPDAAAPSRSVYPQESDVSGAEAYAFDDFNNLMKVMSDWPTFQWLPYAPSPSFSPPYHSAPPSRLTTFAFVFTFIKFRVHNTRCTLSLLLLLLPLTGWRKVQRRGKRKRRRRGASKFPLLLLASKNFAICKYFQLVAVALLNFASIFLGLLKRKSDVEKWGTIRSLI